MAWALPMKPPPIMATLRVLVMEISCWSGTGPVPGLVSGDSALRAPMHRIYFMLLRMFSGAST